MKRVTAVVWLALIVLLGTSAALAEVPQKDLLHGLACDSCHGTEVPKKLEGNGACLSCHVSYSEVAARTAKVEPNPHVGHLGELDCTACHKPHGESELVCNQCHEFDIKMPKGTN